MSIVYVNLGSNLGDRKRIIDTALEKISEKFGICCISEFIESEPWGYESENRFLNLGVSFATTLLPEQVLSELQVIEKSICSNSHRDSEGRYIDREIDVDIMAIDDIVYKSNRLQIPHPHLYERDFFIKPLLELNPFWKCNIKPRDIK